MAIIKRRGQNTISTLGGSIRIEEGNGRIVIYDGTKDLNIIDKDGYLFSDGESRKIKIGNSPGRDRVGIWQAKPGEDVIDLLEEG